MIVKWLVCYEDDKGMDFDAIVKKYTSRFVSKFGYRPHKIVHIEEQQRLEFYPVVLRRNPVVCNVDRSAVE